MDGDKTPKKETTSELVVLPLYSKTTHFDHLVHSILLNYQNNAALAQTSPMS